MCEDKLQYILVCFHLCWHNQSHLNALLDSYQNGNHCDLMYLYVVDAHTSLLSNDDYLFKTHRLTPFVVDLTMYIFPSLPRLLWPTPNAVALSDGLGRVDLLLLFVRARFSTGACHRFDEFFFGSRVDLQICFYLN